jgi:hypothetical protein
MKNNLKHEQRKSYRVWALPSPQLAPFTSLEHYKRTINKNHKGQYGNTSTKLGLSKMSIL